MILTFAMDPDYEQLSNDIDLISRMKQFGKATDQVVDTLKLIDNQQFYEDLNNSDKIKYNLLMSFGMNTLFWMYLRAEGIDPSTHKIKGENERLKQSMARSQRIKDKKTMPRLDKKAARRFVKHGLWTPGTNTNGVEEPTSNGEPMEENWDEPPSTQQTQENPISASS
ncbi:nuclear nucleic acid-binding protein C1D [Venturia canescens]|uniref:nuclear nucleic acid-binding protein C1D n=1 Tax=Venturia canescens TaxID=32260 RepID=UPI001C9C773B|nr:nuclear nucleic acid-binding protein C1D [Venturia canescens]